MSDIDWIASAASLRCACEVACRSRAKLSRLRSIRDPLRSMTAAWPSHYYRSVLSVHEYFHPRPELRRLDHSEHRRHRSFRPRPAASRPRIVQEHTGAAARHAPRGSVGSHAGVRREVFRRSPRPLPVGLSARRSPSDRAPLGTPAPTQDRSLRRAGVGPAVLWLYGADTTAHSGPLGSEVWGEIICGPDRVAGVTAGARILVAEDEAALRRVLVLYLTRAGYEVVEASDGVRALATLLGGGIDAALIDVMLPEMDGFEVVRQARPHSSIPMLFLTAKGEEAHRVAGLERGADDYIVKPFFAEEVVSRVRAHLRRAAGFTEPPTSLRRGTVELKVSERRCLVSGQEVLLTRREFDLLALLMGHPGQVFSREQLLENVWGSPFFTIKTVDVHISALRRKLGGSLTISAMRGVGYRLEPH